MILKEVLLIASICTVAQMSANNADSVVQVDYKPRMLIGHYTVKDAFRNNFTCAGLGFIAAGFCVKAQKRNYRELRHYFLPTFKTTWDDYAQYTPLLATWTLNIAGVQGRSSTKRLAVSYISSAVVMAALVNGMKYTTKEQRPDGTSNNSFPSGHTATAFMAATILHKEYGLTRSPWYSVAGYSLATATGVCRILNNRHWISDVLVGAGIGIISTDMGYFLGDLIFKERGLKHNYREEIVPNLTYHPSFIGLSVDMGVGPSRLKTPTVYDNYDANGLPFKTGDKAGVSHPLGLELLMGTSSAVTVEGAGFFNKYIGVGGRIRATSIPIIAKVDLTKGFQYDISSVNGANDVGRKFEHFVGLESNHIGMFDFSVGAYLSYPLNSRLRLGSKLLIGSRLTTDYSVDAIVDADVEGLRHFYEAIPATDRKYFDTPDEKADILENIKEMGDGKGLHEPNFLTITSKHTPIYSTGVSLTWAYKQGMSFKAQLNYDYSAPEYNYHLENRWKAAEDGTETYITDTFTHRTAMHNLNLGLGMVYHF